MDLPWGSEISNKFITNVGLITSNGPNGNNIMAAEWTHHISYNPGLIAVCIHPVDATTENIEKTKEFGVNLCSIGQSSLSSISGGYTGKKHDKVKALEKLGFKFYKAKKINVLMVKEATANIECKLVKQFTLGDHIMFVGEAVESSSSDIQPLTYHGGKYWILNTNINKQSEKEREKITKILEEFKK